MTKKDSADDDFELWLEFEHVEDVIDDFCNIRVELPDGTGYALNVWTFDYFLNALQSQSDLTWPELSVGYSRAPDLFVSALVRPTIEAAVADMLANGGLPDDCLDEQHDGRPEDSADDAGAVPPSQNEVTERSNPVWQVIEGSEYSELWDRFDATFSFNPTAWRDRRPVIEAPPGSVTFDLEHATGTWAVHAINALVVWALERISADDPPLLVLDWQHPAYRFWPRRSVLYGGERPFPFEVFPFPDGDYYAFVTDDLREGTFGHPWEPSLCVFGERLVPILRPALAPLAPVLREA